MSAGELPLAQAFAELVALLPPPPAVETVPASSAHGRMLADDVVSIVDAPAFDNSAMDGYALRFVDLSPGHELREIGRAYAGHPFDGEVQAGTCVRIMTGAPLPDGADTVVMLEDVDAGAGRVSVLRRPAAGANIRRRGEHIACGAIAIAAGRQLRSADLGLAAAVGATRLAVHQRLRIGLLSTGDELANPPQPLGRGGSFDANRPFLGAACSRCGFEVHDLGIVGDLPNTIAAARRRARELGLDVLLTSGGAAQGDADIVRAAAGVHFVPLAFRPGRGIVHARFDEGDPPLTLFGLPGNAVAAYVTFHLLVRPLLLRLAGGDATVPLHLPLPLAGPAILHGGRIDYRRARLVCDDKGQLQAALLRDQGSAMLRTVTEADALVALGPQPSYAEGDLVQVVPLALFD